MFSRPLIAKRMIENSESIQQICLLSDQSRTAKKDQNGCGEYEYHVKINVKDRIMVILQVQLSFLQTTFERK